MITDLNKIIAEWSYRTRDGKPDVNNNAKLILLEGVLTEFGWSREAKAELLNSLLKEDDIEKFKKKLPENTNIEINISCPNINKQLINTNK